MMIMHQSRIKEARLRRGWTIEHAVARTNRSAGWLSEVESSKREVSMVELQNLAMDYEVPFSYFSREPGVNEITLVPSDRKLYLQRKAERTVMLRVRDSFELLSSLEKEVHSARQEASLPEWQGGKQTAQKIRSRYYDDFEDVSSVTELIERMGILVIETSLGKDLSSLKENVEETKKASMHGFSFEANERYSIVIAQEVEGVQRREALCEELGNVLMDSSGKIIDREEVAEFVRNILLPEEVLQQLYPANGILKRFMLECLQNFYGVSARLLLDQLKSLGYLKGSRYYYWLKKFKDTPASREMDKFFCETSRYFRNLIRHGVLNHKISCDYTEELDKMMRL